MRQPSSLGSGIGGLATGSDSEAAAHEERERLLARLELAQAAGGIGIHDYDIVNDRIEWDARTRAIWGVGDDEPLSYATFAAGLHPDDLAATEAAVAAANAPGSDGRLLIRYRVLSRDGTLRHVEATGRTLFSNGAANRMVGTVRDVTNEVIASQQLEQARLFAENLIRTAPTLLYVYDLVEKRNTFIGPQIGPMTSMLAARYDELGSDLLPAVIHPDDLERVAAHHLEIREGRVTPPFEIEYRLRRDDGSWLWLSSTEVVHARDEQGMPTQILGASLDVTRRRDAEALRELLIGEMAHRMGNLMSVIQSIASLTLRIGCEPGVWAAFNSRMCALATAQELLTVGDWRSAAFDDVARTVLQPFNGGNEQRISFVGPTMHIEGAEVAAVALALHELATNAVKYGALSVAGGRVELVWHVDGDAKRLEWRERGGPPAVAPKRKGFGSRMIASLAKSGDGSGLMYRPEGLVCRLSL
jgi:PAS domain S-box-containing protein